MPDDLEKSGRESRGRQGEEEEEVLPDIEAGHLIPDNTIERVASRQSTLSARQRLAQQARDPSRPSRPQEPNEPYNPGTEEAEDPSYSSDTDSQNDLSGSRTLEGAQTLEATSTSDKVIISFDRDDPENPYYWPQIKKMYVLGASINAVMVSVVSSAIASNNAFAYGAEFGVSSNYLLILPTSIYLLGYAVGPPIWGPLSEQFGRKWVMIIASSTFVAWMLGCALSENFASLVIFRFFGGVAAACSIVVVGGTCADVYRSPESRGRAMATLMGVTTFGPCVGPILSGYITPVLNWRWAFWVGLIYSGISVIPLALVPETYGPVLLRRRAQRLRKQTGNDAIRAPIELEGKADLKHIVSVVLTRPLRMLVSEAIVTFTCLYLSFIYGIFYMLFQSFPIIYGEIYGFSPGEQGLVFLAIGAGAIFAITIYLWWDWYGTRARKQGKAWMEKEEMRRLPIACMGGPMFVASSFWLGWTARPDIHWIVPVLSGVLFGVAYLLIFMAHLNYLVDAYKIFAASAMAAASTTRASFGVILPFGGRPLYRNLGVPWACSLLGFISILLAAIPFVFIWKGEAIRARSKFCKYLVQREIEEEEKRKKREERERRRRLRAGIRDGMTNGEVNGKQEKDIV